MPTVITYQEGDRLAVVYPAPDVPVEEAAKTDVPEGVPHAFVDSATLPDRYFRDAWEFDGPTGAKVNVEKAKEVQRNVWRRIRASKLEALDLEVIKAVERGDAKRRNAIAAEKQALRDVTDHPLPDDLEGIKATIPDILLP
jgi:hypothetical protein